MYPENKYKFIFYGLNIDPWHLNGLSTVENTK